MSFAKNFKQYETLRNAGFKAKLDYWWDYYKVHTFVAIGLFIFLVIMIYGNITRKDTIFYAAMVHCSDVSEEAVYDFRENYIVYAGIDVNKNEIQVVSNPDQLILNMAAAQVDVVVSDFETFSYDVNQNFFYDLREIMSEEQLVKYEPYFYYVDQTILDAEKNFSDSDDIENVYLEMPDPSNPEEMGQPVPVGLFVTDCTVITETYNFGNEYIVIGVVGNAPHVENALKYIDYLFE